SDEEWWAARSAALLELVPDFAERFPAVSGLEAEGPVEPYPGEEAEPVPYPEREARETFRVGLGVLLDGIEAARAGRT
ncbi:TetR/AcrR family transcriptional regulator, partial [Streptomyces sp. SID4931]